MLGNTNIVDLPGVDAVDEEAASLIALTLRHHDEALLQQQLLLEHVNW